MSDSKGEVSRFVVLAVPRSGSNMLCSMLNSHPAILCHHEVFNPRDLFYALDLRRTGFTLGSVGEREEDPLGTLDRIWAADCGRSCVGFKFNLGQSEAVLERVLRDESVKKIILRRRNRIKTFVSLLIAQELDQWEVYDGGDLIGKRPKVKVKLDELQDNILLNERYYRRIERSVEGPRQHAVDVFYEDLFEREAVSGLLEFLGMSADACGIGGMKAESVKQNSDSLEDLIDNFADLRGLVRGTGLEAELS